VRVLPNWPQEALENEMWEVLAITQEVISYKKRKDWNVASISCLMGLLDKKEKKGAS